MGVRVKKISQLLKNIFGFSKTLCKVKKTIHPFLR